MSEIDHKPKPLPYEEVILNLEYLSGAPAESEMGALAYHQNLEFLRFWQENGVAERFEGAKKFEAALGVEVTLNTDVTKLDETPRQFIATDLRSRSLSPMCTEAELNRVVRHGSITPPVDPCTTFCCDELRIPNPTGTSVALAYSDLPQEKDRVFSPPKYFDSLVGIEYPNTRKSTRVPVPVGGIVCRLREDFKIERPGDFDPVIWRIRGKPEVINYGISRQDGPTSISSEAFQALKPSKEEMLYWQSALMFSPAIKDYLNRLGEEGRIEDLFSGVSSIMLQKNSSTGLTNFAYVCSPAFGEFLLKHRDDLPLIMSTLKRGHCDYLSWYFAATMRAFGAPCFMTTDMTVTPEGDAFNSAYLHARGLFINEFNEIVTFCPASRVNFDKAYHTEKLDLNLLNELDRALLASRTVQEKIDALYVFKRSIDSSRGEIDLGSESPSDYLRALASFGESGLVVKKGEVISTDRSGDAGGLEIEGWSVGEVLGRMEKLATLKDWDGGSVERTLLREEYGAFKSFSQNASYREFRIDLKRLQELAKGIGIPSILLERYISSTNSVLFSDGDWKLGDANYPLGHICEYFLQLFSVRDSTSLDVLVNSAFSGDLPIGNYRSKDLMAHPLKQHLSNALYDRLRGEILSPKMVKSLVANEWDGDFLRYVEKADPNDCAYKPTEVARSILRDTLILGFFFQTDNDEAKTWRCYSQLSPEDWNRIRKRVLVPDQATSISTTKHGPRDISLNDLPRDRELFEKLSAVTQALTLSSKDHSKLKAGFLRTLQSLDVQVSHSQERVDYEHRRYSPGDDARLIDWNLSARSMDLHIKEPRGLTRGFVSPVHLLIDLVLFGPVNLPTLEVLLDVARENSERHRRDLFLGFVPAQSNIHQPKPFYGNYAKFKGSFIDAASRLLVRAEKSSESAQKIRYDSLLDREDIPRNLIYITDNFAREAQIKNLYGRRINLRVVNLADPAFHVFLACRESWVRDGPKRDSKSEVRKS